MHSALAVAALVIVSSLAVGAVGPDAAQRVDSVEPADVSQSLHPGPDSSIVGADGSPAPIAVPDSRLPASTRAALPTDRGSLPDSAAALPEHGVNISDIGVGSTRFFLSIDEILLQYYFKEYELRTVGDHVEIWVATDLGWPTDDPRETPVVTDRQAAYLADVFDERIYPVEREFFGTPDERTGANSSASAYGLPADYWVAPDGGNRTIVLVDNIRGPRYYNSSYPIYTAGFYDQTYGVAHDRNIVTIDGARWDTDLGPDDAPWRPDDANETDPFTVEGALAHEFQHLIQADVDPDESTWLNEGLSNLAMHLTGYADLLDDHVGEYERNPSNSLTAWGDQGDINILADYGAAHLFTLYLYEQRGPEFARELAVNPANGAASVESVTANRGGDASFADVYRDWSAALVGDSLAADGFAVEDRYRFESVDLDVAYGGNTTAPAWGSSYTVVPVRAGQRIPELTVSGVAYPESPWRSVPDPFGGSPALWSGGGDLVNDTAVFEADLRGVDDATLRFETLYDIEYAWDYGFVQVSADGGETWTSLENENTTSVVVPDAHPDIASSLPGFTGTTPDWTTESFDLSEYGGQRVLVALRYSTDWAFTGAGWFVRNVTVPEANVAYDGSSAEPFVSVQEARGEPIEYQFTLVSVGTRATAAVERSGPVTFSDAGSVDLGPASTDGDLAGVVVIATWIAPPGESGSVPYELEDRSVAAPENETTATPSDPVPVP